MDKITSSQVIEILGGNKKVAELFEVSEQAVSNWKVRGIPNARLHVIKFVDKELYKRLREQGITTPATKD